MCNRSMEFAPLESSGLYNNSANQGTNGRIDLLSPAPLLDIPAYQRTNVDNRTFSSEATVGQVQKTPLSDLYFCADNINILQDAIRYRVWVETDQKYVIGRQSDTELKIVMRSIFYQHAMHKASDVVGQVRELNTKVLEWVVPEVVSNLKQYEVYRKDASTLPVPMERAQLSTAKGTRILEQKTFM